jgi:protein dithiol oxidoreductase (disulfide-forming)
MMSKFARRDFLRLSGAMLVGGVCAPVQAAIEWGREYVPVTHQQPSAKGEIEVLEFFSYTCPHCYHLEPTIAPWAKALPKDVTFHQVPVAFNNAAKLLAKAYYATEVLGLHDRLHLKFFAAMHDEHVPLTREESLRDWLAKQGVDAKKFMDAMESFAVQSQVARAVQLSQAFDIDAVPTLIVGGKYLTSVGHAGSQDRLPSVLDELVRLVRQERAGKVAKAR